MNNVFNVGTLQLMENGFLCFYFVKTFPCALSNFCYLTAWAEFLIQNLSHIK